MTRQDAIKQLEWYFNEDDGIAADEITKQAIGVAINALKAQEPQILTLQELRKLAYLGDDEAVYVENNGEDDCYTGWAEPDGCRNDEVVLYSFGHGEEWLPNNDNYGKTWRCWDKKPSEEQQNSVAWDN